MSGSSRRSSAMSMSASTSPKPGKEGGGFWQRTKASSKSGFDKMWAYADKLGDPVNKLSNRLGSEAFWPTTLDKESHKAARILKSFCKDGFYDEEITQTEEGPKQKQKVLKKIPAQVIKKAKGLAIFTTMRTGLWISGAGGSGVLVARKEDGTWSAPVGILLHTAGLGFLVGVDIYDCVLVLNTQEAVDAFSKWRATIGGEISAVTGPVGMGGIMDSEFKKTAPIFTYLKSRGFYAGVQIDGTVVIERTDEDERFYGRKITAKEILTGKIWSRSYELQVLAETLKAAEGSKADHAIIPSDASPADYELVEEGQMFGVPSKDDPDPFGVLALQREGFEIKEASTQKVAASDEFEFKPIMSSPVYDSFRKSSDSPTARQRESWRRSNLSQVSSSTARHRYTTSDISTQTDFNANNSDVPKLKSPPPLPPRVVPPQTGAPATPQSLDEEFTSHGTNTQNGTSSIAYSSMASSPRKSSSGRASPVSEISAAGERGGYAADRYSKGIESERLRHSPVSPVNEEAPMSETLSARPQSTIRSVNSPTIVEIPVPARSHGRPDSLGISTPSKPELATLVVDDTQEDSKSTTQQAEPSDESAVTKDGLKSPETKDAPKKSDTEDTPKPTEPLTDSKKTEDKAQAPKIAQESGAAPSATKTDTEDEHDDEHDDEDDDEDDEEIELGEIQEVPVVQEVHQVTRPMVHTVSGARVVSVTKKPTPQLPTRNPGRVRNVAAMFEQSGSSNASKTAPSPASPTRTTPAPLNIAAHRSSNSTTGQEPDRKDKDSVASARTGASSPGEENPASANSPITEPDNSAAMEQEQSKSSADAKDDAQESAHPTIDRRVSLPPTSPAKAAAPMSPIKAVSPASQSPNDEDNSGPKISLASIHGSLRQRAEIEESESDEEDSEFEDFHRHADDFS